jgi:hypothetical protein
MRWILMVGRRVRMEITSHDEFVGQYMHCLEPGV